MMSPGTTCVASAFSSSASSWPWARRLSSTCHCPEGFINGSGDLRYAQTMAFTTLMLFQLFNVFNARSDVSSAFVRLFTNPWLWAALVLSLALHGLVIYTPFLQQAFATTPLSVSDWLLCLVVASSVLWMRELNKAVARFRRTLSD